MKAFVIVAVAVVALLGIGWYFANSNFHGTGTGAHAAAVSGASGNPALGAQKAKPQELDQRAQQQAFAAASRQSRETGVTRPSDQLGEKQNLKIEFDSSGKQVVKHANKNSDEPEFQMPADPDEVVGKYVHRQMVYPKARSREREVPMNDDLLVLEGRSEDRLSATR